MEWVSRKILFYCFWLLFLLFSFWVYITRELSFPFSQFNSKFFTISERLTVKRYTTTYRFGYISPCHGNVFAVVSIQFQIFYHIGETKGQKIHNNVYNVSIITVDLLDVKLRFVSTKKKNISSAISSQQNSGKNSESKKNCHEKLLKNLLLGVDVKLQNISGMRSQVFILTEGL